MKKQSINIGIGDVVQFRYRHDSSIILVGTVANVLTNTIVVDVSDMSHQIPGFETRQLVKRGCYKKIQSKKELIAQ
ncbi:methyltransferase [Bacillus arachidis]|uniref:methyltransferase n=1 Tax=Bacillus arachidis TaxID=2819290 RepID=UPI00255C64AF|nr:methyltransferase [Bacillus arachidis]WIY62899.1 methyltransferase [Bacillus arachidis]